MDHSDSQIKYSGIIDLSEESDTELYLSGTSINLNYCMVEHVLMTLIGFKLDLSYKAVNV